MSVRRTDALRDQCLDVLSRRLTESGWTGDDLSEFVRTEMHAQMREDAALTEHFRDRMTERLLQTAEELRRIDDALAGRGPATLQPSPEKFVAATGWYR